MLSIVSRNDGKGMFSGFISSCFASLTESVCFLDLFRKLNGKGRYFSGLLRFARNDGEMGIV
jgi:hypothetical protein